MVQSIIIPKRALKKVPKRENVDSRTEILIRQSKRIPCRPLSGLRYLPYKTTIKLLSRQ